MAVPVFARLGHLREVKVSIMVITLSVTGNQSRYKGKTPELTPVARGAQDTAFQLGRD